MMHKQSSAKVDSAEGKPKKVAVNKTENEALIKKLKSSSTKKQEQKDQSKELIKIEPLDAKNKSLPAK